MRQSPGAYGHTAQPPRAGWLPRERQHLEEVVYEPQLVGSTPRGVSAQDRGKCTGRQAEERPPGYRATAKRSALLELVAPERGARSDRPNPGRLPRPTGRQRRGIRKRLTRRPSTKAYRPEYSHHESSGSFPKRRLATNQEQKLWQHSL